MSLKKNTHLERGCSCFDTATLLCNGGEGGGGTASASTDASRPSSDSDAPSTLCGGSCVAPTAAYPTIADEPTGLTAHFPSARTLGVSASDAG